MILAERNAQIAPFLMRFGERIDPLEVTPVVEGQYNPRLQVWEYSKKISEKFPVASFPAQEKPPTVSTVVTWVRPQPRTDMGPDD